MTVQDLQAAVADIMAQRHNPDDLLTQDETAQVLDVKPPTLANWRCTKRVALPFVKIGKRSVRYRWADVQAFIEASRVAA